MTGSPASQPLGSEALGSEALGSGAHVAGAADAHVPDSYTPGYSGDKAALMTRLRRVEGQIRGLQRMVDQDTYCIDVITQISAATRALQAVAVGLLEDHLAHCVVDAARHGDPHAKVREATEAIARLVRA